MNRESIIAVTGFARSGSSLTMAMLRAAGVPLLYEHATSWEHSGTMRLPDDTAWMADANGKAIKFLEPIKCTPPADRQYRAIILTRDPVQQGRSQIKFLRDLCHMHIPNARQEACAMAAGLAHDTPALVRLWERLAGKGNILRVEFEQLIRQPGPQASRIADFVGLDANAAVTMAAQVRPRSSDCYRGLLELELMAAATRV